MPVIVNIDDVAAQRYATTRVLRNAGYTVLEGAEGNDAFLFSQRPDVDAMVLDVDLPDISGFEVLKKLRADKRTSRLPVILISAVFTDQHMVREGFRYGATAYLTLPLDPPRLVAVLSKLLEEDEHKTELR